MVTESGDVVVDSGHKSSFQNMSNVYTSMLEVDEKNENPRSKSAKLRIFEKHEKIN